MSAVSDCLVPLDREDSAVLRGLWGYFQVATIVAIADTGPDERAENRSMVPACVPAGPGQSSRRCELRRCFDGECLLVGRAGLTLTRRPCRAPGLDEPWRLIEQDDVLAIAPYALDGVS
jgi:hypothetical protein